MISWITHVVFMNVRVLMTIIPEGLGSSSWVDDSIAHETDAVV